MNDHESHEFAEEQPAPGSPENASSDPFGGPPTGAGDQMRAILSNVGGHLDQLRQVQSELDGQARLLDERDEALRNAEDLLQADRRALEVARAAHAEAEEGLARRRDEVAAEQEAARAEIEEGRARIEREEGALDEKRAEIDRRAAVVGERSETLTQEQEAFDAERDEWVDRQRAIEETRAQAQADLARREEELARRDEELAARAQELADRDEAFARRAQEIAAEREQFAERAAAAEAALAEHREKAEQAATGAAAELTARCAELEASLVESRERAETATTEGLEVAHEAELERDQLREQLEALQTDLSRTTSELEQAALQRDANDARERETREAMAAVEQRVKELEGQLADARPDQDIGADVRLRAMQQKIQKLEAETRKAKIAAPDRTENVDEIRQKAHHLARVAAHLRRRHGRLKKARQLFSRRKAAGKPSVTPPPRVAPPPSLDMDRHAEQTRRLEKLRLELGEQRAGLLKAEKRMVRRWAAGRAIAAVGWMMIMALVSAGVGWLGADHFVPATISASVTIDAEKKGLDHLSEQEAAEWVAWHQAIVFDDAFMRNLSNRLSERRLDGYAEPNALRDRLTNDLTFDATIPNRLTFTLAGTDAKETTALLDLLVTTVVTESNHQLRKRAVKPWAELPAGRKGKTRTEYAAVNDVPIEDHRLEYAGPIAGVVFIVLCTLVLFTYRRLVQVKREIDADNTLFDDTPMRAEPSITMIGG